MCIQVEEKESTGCHSHRGCRNCWKPGLLDIEESMQQKWRWCSNNMDKWPNDQLSTSPVLSLIPPTLFMTPELCFTVLTAHTYNTSSSCWITSPNFTFKKVSFFKFILDGGFLSSTLHQPTDTSFGKELDQVYNAWNNTNTHQVTNNLDSQSSVQKKKTLNRGGNVGGSLEGTHANVWALWLPLGKWMRVRGEVLHCFSPSYFLPHPSGPESMHAKIYISLSLVLRESQLKSPLSINIGAFISTSSLYLKLSKSPLFFLQCDQKPLCKHDPCF